MCVCVCNSTMILKFNTIMGNKHTCTHTHTEGERQRTKEKERGGTEIDADVETDRGMPLVNTR